MVTHFNCYFTEVSVFKGLEIFLKSLKVAWEALYRNSFSSFFKVLCVWKREDIICSLKLHSILYLFLNMNYAFIYFITLSVFGSLRRSPKLHGLFGGQGNFLFFSYTWYFFLEWHILIKFLIQGNSVRNLSITHSYNLFSWLIKMANKAIWIFWIFILFPGIIWK